MRTQTLAPDHAELTNLIARIADGDRNALSVLYRQAAPRLFAAALRIVRRREVAEDVVQETFLTLWQRAGSYDASLGSPMAWLATIARRKAIDHVRRAARTATDDIEVEEEIAAEHVDPLALAEKAEDAAKLVEGLSGLDRERLQMVLLAYVFGWSRDDLARHFDRPTGTIKTWLHRTVADLRRGAADETARGIFVAMERDTRKKKTPATVAA